MEINDHLADLNKAVEYLNTNKLVFSTEHRAKLSKALKGNKRMLGHKHTEETKLKMSIARTGKPPNALGYHHTEEAKKRISLSKKGKPRSEETKRKLSEANKGHVPSEETRKKMSEARFGKKNLRWGEKHSGENNHMFGKKHSEESRKKISESLMGKHPSFETLKRRSETLRGRIPSEEIKLRRSKNLPRCERHSGWKGDTVGYGALHEWIRRRLPKPIVCEHCHAKEPYDLANRSNKYKREVSDWEWLCRRCHMIKDGRIEKLRSRNKKEVR